MVGGSTNIGVVTVLLKEKCLPWKGHPSLVELASPVREPYGGPGLECDRDQFDYSTFAISDKDGYDLPAQSHENCE